MLDTNVPSTEKLYGYHRLEDPFVTTTTQGNLLITRKSKMEPPEPLDNELRNKSHIIGRKDIEGVTYEKKKK